MCKYKPLSLLFSNYLCCYASVSFYIQFYFMCLCFTVLGVISVTPTTIGLCSSICSFNSFLLFSRESALKYIHVKALFTLYTGLLLEVVTPDWGGGQLEPGLGLYLAPFLFFVCFCSFLPPPFSLKGSCLFSDICFHEYHCQILSTTWLCSEAAFSSALFLVVFSKVCFSSPSDITF